MNKPKKIAYLTTAIGFGGSEKVTLNLLRSAGHLKSSIKPFLMVRPWEEKGTLLQELDKLNIHYQTLPVAAKPPAEGNDYLRIIRCIRLLMTHLQAGKYDLIHTSGYFADIIGIMAARYLGVKVLATCHGFISNDAKLKFYNNLDIFMLRYATRVIAVSSVIMNELVGKHVPKRKIVHIQNAVSANPATEPKACVRKELGVAESEILIGYCGRLSPEKGLRNLMQALILLKQEPIKCLFIGEGPERGFIEKYARDMHIQDKVILLGFQENVEKWMTALDIFVLPSFTEGHPMALLEAMACRVPAICSRVGDIPGIIEDNQSGRLVAPGDVAQLKRAIQEIAADAEVRQRLSGNAGKIIEQRFGLSNWIKKMEDIYDSTILKSEWTA
ncbi:MAG: glycosyltransferase family 1 protein [Desulfobacteraceae bacterium]|nr:MAG: glycosyltransferase family 1 protein [Desulfobacteraceae bacterium]